MYQDGYFWPFRSLTTCAIWVAIDKAGRDNCSVRVIPGLHAKRALFRHHSDGNPDLALYEVLDPDQFEEEWAGNIELEPGQFALQDKIYDSWLAAHSNIRSKAYTKAAGRVGRAPK